MVKRLIELDTCRGDKNCEKAPEHARVKLTNFMKPQDFKKGFFFQYKHTIALFFFATSYKISVMLNSLDKLWVLSKFRFKRENHS